MRSSLVTVIAPDGYPVHNVETGFDYITIQAAINADETLGGHTILVDEGIYFENIVVNKSLTILGENAASTILDSQNLGGINCIINANVTLSGFTMQNGNSGIFVNHSSVVTVRDNIIRNQSYDGVFVQTWGNCNVSVEGNLIAACYRGIECTYSEGFCVLERNNLSQVGSGILIGYGMMSGRILNNTIVGNGGGTGMDLSGFHNAAIEGNCVIGFNDGARFEGSFGNRVNKNTLASNAGFSLGLLSCDNTTVIGNNIENSSFGVWLSSSSQNNLIYHNSFINNSQQAYIETYCYPNAWDNGYPSGGNFWSDYDFSDLFSGQHQNETGSDGIGDKPYVLVDNNTDYYPLMGRLSDFDATSEIHVQTICNSTISNFQFNGTAISFDVIGENGTNGFCRACIPTALMNGTYRVFVNGTEIPSPVLMDISNSTHTYLYFNYTHSTHEVIIIPESPSILTLPPFIMTTLLAVLVYKRKRSV